MIRRIFQSIHVSTDDWIDPLKILSLLDVEEVTGEQTGTIAHAAFIAKPWEQFMISREIADRPHLKRHVGIRILAALIAHRSGQILDEIVVVVGSPMDESVEQLLNWLEARLTIPAPLLMQLFEDEPEAGNFRIARFFETTLEIATARLVHLQALPEPGVDLEKVKTAFAHSRTRLQLVADPDLDRLVSLDPFVIEDPMFDPELKRPITIIQTLARPRNAAAGADIDMILRREATADLQAYFNQLQLEELGNVRDAILAIPGERGVLAWARLLSKLGHAKEADKLLETRKWKSARLNAEALALRARLAAMMSPGAKGWRRAEQICRIALSIDRTCIEAWFGLANALIEVGDGEQALQHLAVLARHPDDSLARFYYTAKAFAQLREFGKALGSFDYVLALPGHPWAKRALARRAKIYADLGDETRAVESFERLLALRPYDMKGAHTYISYLLEIDQKQQAMDHLTRVSRCLPLQPWCARILSKQYADNGDPAMAAMMKEESRLLGTFWQQQHIYTSLGD
jgi:tetratricopeptide (TPR) repeat protein